MRHQIIDTDDMPIMHAACVDCGMRPGRRHDKLNKRGVFHCKYQWVFSDKKAEKPVRQPVSEVIEHPNAMDVIDIHVEPLKHHFCTGCGLKYIKFHNMMNHRRTFRCGGEWLLSKYDAVNKRRLIDDSNLFTANVRRMIRYRKPNGRIPGVVRKSRLKGGPGFRNNWES